MVRRRGIDPPVVRRKFYRLAAEAIGFVPPNWSPNSEIEPKFPQYQSGVLPLNYTGVVAENLGNDPNAVRRTLFSKQVQ